MEIKIEKVLQKMKMTSLNGPTTMKFHKMILLKIPIERENWAFLTGTMMISELQLDP
jgi:hypothetical protein